MDLIGRQFGRITVLERVVIVRPGSKSRGRPAQRTHYRCRCSCGTEKLVDASALVRGLTKSCGCLRRESTKKTGEANRKHGMREHPLYDTWKNMVRRCVDPYDLAFVYYGARGITVCDQWLTDPDAFIRYVISELGDRSNGMSIDRIDNSRGYEPGNLRWATSKEQSANRRKRRVGKAGANIAVARARKRLL